MAESNASSTFGFEVNMTLRCLVADVVRIASSRHLDGAIRIGTGPVEEGVDGHQPSVTMSPKNNELSSDIE